jgi:hypothetical protein
MATLLPSKIIGTVELGLPREPRLGQKERSPARHTDALPRAVREHSHDGGQILDARQVDADIALAAEQLVVLGDLLG